MEQYRQSLDEHVEFVLELLILFVKLFCGYKHKTLLVGGRKV